MYQIQKIKFDFIPTSNYGVCFITNHKMLGDVDYDKIFGLWDTGGNGPKIWAYAACKKSAKKSHLDLMLPFHICLKEGKGQEIYFRYDPNDWHGEDILDLRESVLALINNHHHNEDSQNER